MVSYRDAKKQIKSPLFTEEFYNTYISERASAINHIGDGKAFEKLKTMPFWNDPEKAAFCKIVNKSLMRFTFKYYQGGKLVCKVNGRFASLDEARRLAKQVVEVFGYDSCEVRG